MAQGKKCPICDYFMYAQEEIQEPMGSYVVYVCRACGHTEKVFEQKKKK